MRSAQDPPGRLLFRACCRHTDPRPEYAGRRSARAAPSPSLPMSSHPDPSRCGRSAWTGRLDRGRDRPAGRAVPPGRGSPPRRGSRRLPAASGAAGRRQSTRLRHPAAAAEQIFAEGAFLVIRMMVEKDQGEGLFDALQPEERLVVVVAHSYIMKGMQRQSGELAPNPFRALCRTITICTLK